MSGIQTILIMMKRSEFAQKPDVFVSLSKAMIEDWRVCRFAMRRVALLLCVLMLAPVTSAVSVPELSSEEGKEIIGIEAEPKVLIIGIDGVRGDVAEKVLSLIHI